MKNKNYSSSGIFSIIAAILSVIVASISIAVSFKDISSQMLPHTLWTNIIGSLVGVVTGVMITYLVYRFSKRKKTIRIFISYRQEDKSLAGQLSNSLTKRGYLVFNPETMIHPGESISEKIEDGIKTSDFFMIFFSKPSLTSNWTQKELELALNYRRKIIPLISQQNVELPDQLKDTKYLVINDNNFDNALTELLRTVDAYN